MKVRAIVEWDSVTASFSATCPELNFISSCGDTKAEALANLQDAIQLMLEPLPDSLLEPSSGAEVFALAL
ncbi:hypothetical protein GlitD10_1923 [Gloeomargarita lithophora Alchichica-D10]|uniref:HicB-like antitoxin of toxin-antitoxin system domain-containing protein n=1 Tax=Gloeomargarita lithophora Alchichica-D10 TaxID=1188229 RepID=A0A1J0AE90_9CYAN|nr:type II toxin-antitoxin system HicB family antitoxin [Gloeomargarita lithophora]APB34249.1 hypothetical protein GlitD10_1923 [Gloeomargarita lithophora Alchichica-D10]